MVILGFEELPCHLLKSSTTLAFLIPVQAVTAFAASSILAGNKHQSSHTSVACSQFSPRQLLIIVVAVKDSRATALIGNWLCVSHVNNPV